MYGKFRFSMNGFMYFLMWDMFNFNVTCVPCPAIFNNGYIQSSCNRLPGDSCNFICDRGFVNKGNQLTCGKDGMWIEDTNSICIKSIVCPDVFKGGYIDPICSRRPGESCTFSCYPDYFKRGSWLTCGNNGTWIKDKKSKCIKPVTCPDVFNGGYIQPLCLRSPRYSCTFYCYPGFVKKEGDLLTCGTNGSWIQDTNSICIKADHCPAMFNGGYVDTSCSRLPGYSCTFNCNPEFVKKGDQLTCGNNMTWIQDTDSICVKAVTCPDVFIGGYVEPSCSRVPGDSCTFNCNPGFVKRGNSLTCGNYGNWFPDANSICVILVTCPDTFNGGYIDPFCSRLPDESCTFNCYPEFVKKGYWLTCARNGTWIQDTNSNCRKSVKPMPSYNEPRPTGQTNVGVIVGITTAAFIIVMIIIVSIVVWRAKRSSVRKSQRDPGHAGFTCLRPRENRDQSVTTLRQQPNADGINSVSSFESPSYNGNYFPSFDERIPTISSSCKYSEPPPSYSETQMATNEAPPTYIEAVRDPTRFNLYT